MFSIKRSFASFVKSILTLTCRIRYALIASGCSTTLASPRPIFPFNKAGSSVLWFFGSSHFMVGVRPKAFTDRHLACLTFQVG